MNTPPLAVKITHTGLYADGRVNSASVPLTDIDTTADKPQTRPTHRSAVYVPVGGSITVPLSTRVMYSFVSGQIFKLATDGLITAEVDAGGLDMSYQKVVLLADESSSGDLLTGEEVLTTATLTGTLLEVRRRIHIRGTVTLGFNGADTWTLRVRIGGLVGEIAFNSGALVVADGTEHTFEVDAIIRTLGVGGTFNSSDFATHSGSLAPTSGFNVGGTVDTTADVPVVLTVQSSSVNAGQTVSLTDWSVQILPN